MLQPVRELVQPPNQLHLSQADLAEDIACLLTASNPAAPSNVARYNLRERAYKLDSSVDHIIQHHSSQGWLMHVDSEQAQRQSANEQVTVLSARIPFVDTMPCCQQGPSCVA